MSVQFFSSYSLPSSQSEESQLPLFFFIATLEHVLSFPHLNLKLHHRNVWGREGMWRRAGGWRFPVSPGMMVTCPPTSHLLFSLMPMHLSLHPAQLQWALNIDSSNYLLPCTNHFWGANPCCSLWTVTLIVVTMPSTAKEEERIYFHL